MLLSKGYVMLRKARYNILFLKDYLRNLIFGRRELGYQHNKKIIQDYFDSISKEKYDYYHISAKDDPFLKPIFQHEWFLKKVNDKNNTIADFGCGHGYLSNKLKETISGRYIGFDFSLQSVLGAAKYNRKTDTSFVADVEASPIASGIIDIAFCINVLPYLSSVDYTIDEIYRVLKKDGMCVLVYPVENHYWDTEFDNIKIFLHSPDEINKSLSDKGFSKLVRDDIQFVFFPILPFRTTYAHFLIARKS